jgi:hypothetical protein
MVQSVLYALLLVFGGHCSGSLRCGDNHTITLRAL